MKLEDIVGKNTVISSPAGAGKTTTLVDIFTELLKRDCVIDEIAAITFTNKAAGEMKTRIIDELLREHTGLVKEGYFETGTHFRISTIHSFLRRLIQVVTPELSIGEELAPADLSKSTFESIAARKIRELDQNSLLAHIVSKKLMEYLKGLFDSVPVSYVWAKEILKGSNPLLEYAGREFLREFIIQLAQLFLEVLEEYQQWKAENGYFEYADIEMKAYDAVAESEEVNDILLVFNEHMKALLVDEFQDTSELQWRILRKLAEDWLSGEGLREVTGAAVYLVGDPKQSIYSFRGADVSVMQRVMEEFEELAHADNRHFAHESLKTNYRSAPPIIDVVNEAFSELMLEELDQEKPWKTVYEPFKASRNTDKSGVFLVVNSDDKKLKAEKATMFEASFIANEISRLIKEGEVIEDKQGKVRRLKHSNIAVLIKNRTHIDKYENALIKQGIPFVSLDSGYTSLKPFEFLKSFFQLFDPARQHGAAVALTQLIDEESFDVRGVDDLQKLKYPFSKIYDAYHIFLVYFKDGLYGAYRQALSIMQEILEIKFVPDEVELALKLFDEVMAALDAEGIGSPLELSRRIKHFLTDYLPEISHSANAVQILSIHKAKGLEFPVVFAAGLWNQGRNASPQFLPASAGDGAVARYIPKELNEENQTDLEELKKELKDFKDSIKGDISEFKVEEAKRLYYVAFTRARDYLYVLLPDMDAKSIKKSKDEYFPMRDVMLKLGDKGKVEIIARESPDEAKPGEQEAVISEVGKGFYTRRLTSSDYHVPVLLDGYQPGKKLPLRAEPPSAANQPLATSRQPIEFGNLMHGLLQRYVMEGSIPDEEIPETARPLFETVTKNEQFRELLDGDTLAEIETIELLNGKFKKARMDLLVFKNNLIRIIDYKTEKYSPESVEDKRKTMENYYRIISSIYPDRKVECYLVFLKDMKIEKLV